MKQILFCFFTISVLLLSSQDFNAQAIEAGIWKGTITHPDGMTSEVKNDVKIIEDTLSITMKSKTMGDLPLHEINLGKGNYHFLFSQGHWLIAHWICEITAPIRATAKAPIGQSGE